MIIGVGIGIHMYSILLFSYNIVNISFKVPWSLPRLDCPVFMSQKKYVLMFIVLRALCCDVKGRFCVRYVLALRERDADAAPPRAAPPPIQVGLHRHRRYIIDQHVRLDKTSRFLETQYLCDI